MFFLGDLVGVIAPKDDCFLFAGDFGIVLSFLAGVGGEPTIVPDNDCFLLADDFCLVVSLLVGVAGGPSCDLVRLMIICELNQ